MPCPESSLTPVCSHQHPHGPGRPAGAPIEQIKKALRSTHGLDRSPTSMSTAPDRGRQAGRHDHSSIIHLHPARSPPTRSAPPPPAFCFWPWLPCLPACLRPRRAPLHAMCLPVVASKCRQLAVYSSGSPAPRHRPPRPVRRSSQNASIPTQCKYPRSPSRSSRLGFSLINACMARSRSPRNPPCSGS